MLETHSMTDIIVTILPDTKPKEIPAFSTIPTGQCWMAELKAMLKIMIATIFI